MQNYENFLMKLVLEQVNSEVSEWMKLNEINNQSKITTIEFINMVYNASLFKPITSSDEIMVNFLNDQSSRVFLQDYDVMQSFIKRLYDSYSDKNKWSKTTRLSPEFVNIINEILNYKASDVEIDEFNVEYNKQYLVKYAWDENGLVK